MRPEQPRSKTAIAISIAVHAIVIATIAWSATGGNSAEPGAVGFAGDAPRDSFGGIGGLNGMAREQPAPPLGPSISEAEAKDYLGQYIIPASRGKNVEMLVSHVH